VSTAAQKAPASGPIALLQGILPYDRAWLTRDVVAGVTLAALAIPEVMGYTKIAGTPVVTGLYTLLLPVLAFALLGSSRHLVVGGDSATAAIMFAGIAGLGIAGLQPDTAEWLALAGLSALICGGLLLIARLARLGFLADFISRTVLVGFLTGVGIQVAMGQVAGLLGVPSPHPQVSIASDTIAKFIDTLREIGQASVPTVIVSVVVIATVLVFERWIKAIPGGLVAVVGTIIASYALDLSAHGVSTLGPVPGGLPQFGLPQGVTLENAAALLPTALSMVIVILAQSAATSRAYAVRYREKFVENNDLVGLGLANIGAGLSGTFVVNGSPTKTEMVDEAKSHTQVAQLTTGVVVVLVLLFLTKPLEYLPNAVLSAVVFLIGVKLINVKAMREIWRLRQDEFWVAVTTAVVVVVFGVEQGIVLAIILSIILHVRRHYEPHDQVVTWGTDGREVWVPAAPGTTSVSGLIVYRFGVGVFFANAERLSEEVRALVDVPTPPRWLVLQADGIDDVDFTAATSLVELADQLKDRNVVMAVAGATRIVRAELDKFGLTERIGSDHYFASAEEARDVFLRG
jgi:high affinity sulfate transporter 1